MNRIIKFRAWNKQTKIFESIGFNIIGEVTVFDVLESHSLESLNNLEITQFTGIKDKNGKEIYEGDIVKFSDIYTDLLNNELIIDEIIWKGDRFTPKNNFPCLMGWEKCEVVANIFENPELVST